MKKLYKILLITFILVSLAILVRHINAKLAAGKIPTRLLVSQLADVTVEHLNFDENNKEQLVALLSSEEKYSGNNSIRIVPEVVYVDVFEHFLVEDDRNEFLNSIRLDLMVKAISKFKEVVVVVEISDFTGKLVQWQNLLINPDTLGVWSHIYHSVYLTNEARKAENKIKVFLWNVTGEQFYIDDFSVSLRRSDTEPAMKKIPLLYESKLPLSKETIEKYGSQLETRDSLSFYLHIKPEELFTPAHIIDFETVSKHQLPRRVNISFQIEPKKLNDNIKLAIELVNKDTQQKHFKYFQLPNYPLRGKTRASFDYDIPENFRFNSQLVSYFWNIGGNDLILSDVTYRFF